MNQWFSNHQKIILSIAILIVVITAIAYYKLNYVSTDKKSPLLNSQSSSIPAQTTTTIPQSSSHPDAGSASGEFSSNQPSYLTPPPKPVQDLTAPQKPSPPNRENPDSPWWKFW